MKKPLHDGILNNITIVGNNSFGYWSLFNNLLPPKDSMKKSLHDGILNDLADVIFMAITNNVFHLT
jgi:hypothetical protein